jgi:phosphatidylglycerophosphate synthase
LLLLTCCHPGSAHNRERRLRASRIPVNLERFYTKISTVDELPIQIVSPYRFVAQSANLISASRFVLASIWIPVFFHDRGQSYTLGAIALLGAASDVFDGRIARWTHSASHFGRWLDSVADIVFVLAALSCEAYAGVIPVYLPTLVGASFAQYAVDSVLIRGSMVPVKSCLGHWAGIFNYIIVVTLAWRSALRFPEKLFRDLTPLIALLYLAAMLERAWFYRTSLRPRTSLSLESPRQ